MAYEQRVSREISKLLGELLSKKHLYQSVTLPYNPKDLDKRRRDLTLKIEERFELDELFRLVPAAWVVARTPEEQKAACTNGHVSLLPPRFKNFCKVCGQLSPYAFIGEKFTGKDNPNLLFGVTLQYSQVFFLPYECQGCVDGNEPVIFMVTRRGPKLTLWGRSEIEVVTAPSFLPKDIVAFYRRARHAYNCGER